MSTENPWAKHYQSVWAERSGDPSLPDWLRVAALAYGKHQANGHAMFRKGDVALVLARVDPASGVIAPSRNVTRAIARAVEYGWLARESKTRCLVVPHHAVEGGVGGHPFAKCPVHG